MYGKILVPLDGSSFAEFALPMAGIVAAKAGGELDLVMVQDPVPPLAVGELDNAPDPWRKEYLSAVLDRMKREVAGKADFTLRIGRMPDELADVVAESEADLLVMATHGRGPLSRFWLGSVADHMVRHASCPVLLVRPSEEEEPQLARKPRLRRILVPLDGSTGAEAILKHAFALGDPFDAAYTLLRVVHYPAEIVSSYLPDTVRISEEVVEQGEKEARRYLEELSGRLKDEGHDVDTMVRVDIHPAPSILRVAREVDADVVALATHGRGGVRRTLLGSVADKLIRSAHLPTLVYRPADMEG